ncbi:MAG: hypothetical protein R2744_12660 [Bacteroidales bacterium]
MQFTIGKILNNNYEKFKLLASILLLLLAAGEASYSQDWENLERFKTDNMKIGPLSKEKRIVFMGNSITEDGAVSLRVF